MPNPKSRPNLTNPEISPLAEFPNFKLAPHKNLSLFVCRLLTRTCRTNSRVDTETSGPKTNRFALRVNAHKFAAPKAEPLVDSDTLLPPPDTLRRQ